MSESILIEEAKASLLDKHKIPQSGYEIDGVTYTVHTGVFNDQKAVMLVKEKGDLLEVVDHEVINLLLG